MTEREREMATETFWKEESGTIMKANLCAFCYENLEAEATWPGNLREENHSYGCFDVIPAEPEEIATLN